MWYKDLLEKRYLLVSFQTKENTGLDVKRN